MSKRTHNEKQGVLKMSRGFIYIFTNPSFPQFVKIGYATDVKQRLNELNRSTAVPFAFRIYATYEVDSALSDKKLHSILDKLNPELRSIEDVGGKLRVREFYEMTPEDAYSILEAIAEINNYSDRLVKWKATKEERRDEEMAQEAEARHQERMTPFDFTKCNIGIGEEIEFWHSNNPHNGEICVVVDDKHVRYEGEIWSLSSLAKSFIGCRHTPAGPRYFKYKGKWLNDIRHRLGV